MREKTTRFVGILFAAGLLGGGQAGAALLAYEGFDTSAAGDAANGVYQTGVSFTNAANATVAGGSMVGFQASDAWSGGAKPSEFLMPMNGKGGANIVVNDAEKHATRAITASLSGKTVAWQSATMSMDYEYAAGYNPIAIAGYGGNDVLYRIGAYLGFKWDGSNWDLIARYQNTSGSAVYNVVVEDLGATVGELHLMWKMDDASNELSVWVNATSTNDAPVKVFTDYNNSVEYIDHINILTYRLGRNSSGARAFLIDDMKLGDSMDDVFAPYTGLLAFEGFDSADVADPTNGIYQTGVSFTNAANANVAGGRMIGFQASDAWSAGGKVCDYLMPMNGKGGANIVVSDSEKHATRAIAASLSGKTVAWQSATMGIDYEYGGTYTPIAVAGYGGNDVLYRVGAYLGFRRDGSNWDLVARYKNTAGSAVWQVVKEDLGRTEAKTFLVWKMDDANDELSIWIDVAETNTAPDVVLSDYANTVADIDHINILTYRLGRNSTGESHAFLVDDLKLGETMQSVMPKRTTSYSDWAETWGVDIGASTNDYDGDGLINLYEYGLDGDPTDAQDVGTSPEFDIATIGGTNGLRYIYPQRSAADSGLSYYLELSTDLLAGTWTNSGYTVEGTNDTGGVLDFVTNVTGTVESGKFIRLRIIEE